MDALQANIYSAAGESKGKMDLPTEIFQGETSRYVLHETIRALQANQRRGTSQTKTRGVVSGGGRKPWKQKVRAMPVRAPIVRRYGERAASSLARTHVPIASI